MALVAGYLKKKGEDAMTSERFSHKNKNKKPRKWHYRVFALLLPSLNKASTPINSRTLGSPISILGVKSPMKTHILSIYAKQRKIQTNSTVNPFSHPLDGANESRMSKSSLPCMKKDLGGLTALCRRGSENSQHGYHRIHHKLSV